MNTLKRICLSMSASTMILGIAPAHAADSFSGIGSKTYDPTTGRGTFYDVAIPAGRFTDTITFTNPTNALMNNIFFDVNNGGLGNVSANLNGYSLSSAISPLGIGATRFSLSGLSTVAGNSILTISGLSSGGLFASIYVGEVRFTAVPEPAAWVLMIGGLGLAGAALRRRQRVTLRTA